MKKLSRKNLDELAKVMPVLSETEQRMFVGGGSATASDPYTMEEFERMLISGTWEGGYEIGYEAGLTGGLLATAKAMAISGIAAFGMGSELGDVNYDSCWLIQGVIRGYIDGQNSRLQ